MAYRICTANLAKHNAAPVETVRATLLGICHFAQRDGVSFSYGSPMERLFTRTAVVYSGLVIPALPKPDREYSREPERAPSAEYYARDISHWAGR